MYDVGPEYLTARLTTENEERDGGIALETSEVPPATRALPSTEEFSSKGGFAMKVRARLIALVTGLATLLLTTGAWVRMK